MTARMTGGGMIELAGDCSSEDAEPLLRLLLSHPRAVVDWRGCRRAHAAVVQVLMAARPALRGPPADAGLAQWVEPVITRPSPGGIS
ncbi:MAG TPA: STAS domain-containing protein [Steroidobacteraceae bacterium]|nr:STAS domain-containing protein [Steroidobacteraceae bacterium]